MHLRDASRDDADLLVDLLLEAFNWTGEARFTREDVLRDPHTVRYVGGWGRPGDLGLVAVEDGGALGGAWARALTSDEPGYGYVADDVPELSMAVLPGPGGAASGPPCWPDCWTGLGTPGGGP